MLSFDAHKQLTNLAREVQSLREQVLDSKVACLQAKQACLECKLQPAANHLEESINNIPDEQIIEACKRRLSRLHLRHCQLNLNSIFVNLTALTDEYKATVHQIEVVQEGLMILLDRAQVYYTAGLIEDFYELESKHIAFFFEQKLTERPQE